MKTLTFKRNLLLVFTGIGVSFILAVVCHAFTLLTKEQALEDVLGKGVKIETETQRLRGSTLEDALKRLGGTLVYEQVGSESEKVAVHKKVEFYFAVKDGEKKKVAIIDTQPGRWGPVEFIIAMDLKPRILEVKVMSYQEKRGRPIARRSFMQQYVGKTSRSTLTVGRDITGISGATISSRAATFAVKKALVLYEEFYLKGKK